jgi:alginate O-acetyltransferase complex protein AlgJ
MERLINFIYIKIFCGVLAIVPLFFALGICVQSTEGFLQFDQRPRSALAQPGRGREALKNHFASFERFLCDRLPFREHLLKARAKINLHFGKLLNPEVVVLGKDGWLFFGNAVGGGIDQYRGLVSMDASQLNAFQKYFGDIHRQLEKSGIPFFVVIGPDKHTIYPEFLPKHLSKKGITPGDQIIARPMGFGILDLRPILLAQKKEASLPLYYKTDSHWNEYGAYLAYRSIMARLPTVASVEAKEADFIPLPVTGNGDLSVKVGGAISFSDSLTHIRRNFFPGTLEVENLQDGRITQQGRVDMTRVSQFHSLKVSNPAKTGSLLVFGDSFSDNISRFFNNTFGHVVYQHYTECGSSNISGLVAKFQPHAVVFLMVERNLIQPVSKFIPVSGAMNSKNTPQTSSTASKKTNSSPSSLIISNDRLFSESSLVRGIKNIRMEKGGGVFTSTGDDPYFHLPRVPPMLAGATVAIELTLPAERLVQLFYQTTDKPDFTEGNSVTKILPAGRHLIEWPIKAALNGTFRFDPGNGPGDYQIQKVEILPWASSQALGVAPAFAFAIDKLVAESSLVREIANVRLEEGVLFFTSNGDNPYFHFPPAPPMPDGATVAIELTLPAERLVQLFYQTTGKPEFTEEQSVTKILPSGRHVIECPIKAALNGTFRLDPGNGPGDYRIHKVEIRP